MAHVYGNAHLTIVASNAKDASEGFLQRRQRQNGGIRLPLRIATDTFGSVIVQRHDRDFTVGLRVEPIDKRAWTLQEHLLGRRLLLYRAQTLQWHCAYGALNMGQSLYYSATFNPNLPSQLGTNPEEVWSEWERLVGKYTLRLASLPMDKLPAIAALAEKFAPMLGQYYAGIWGNFVTRALEWKNGGDTDWEEEPYPYRAPSWSWASTGTSAFYSSFEERASTCKVVSIHTLLKDPKVPYGEVLGGSITLQGKLLLFLCSWTISGYLNEAALCTHQNAQHSPPTRYFKAYLGGLSSRGLPSGMATVPMSVTLDGTKIRRSRIPGLVCKYILTLKQVHITSANL